MTQRNIYDGSFLMELQSGVELTDAEPNYVSQLLPADSVKDLEIDVVSNKGCTVDVARYHDDKGLILGFPGTQGVVADAGTGGVFELTSLGCAAVKVTITKTELGSTTGFVCTTRGQAG